MGKTTPSADIASVQIGEEVRDFTLDTVDGNTFSLCDFRGKNAVILGIGNPYR